MIRSDRYTRPQAWTPMSSRPRGPGKGHSPGALALTRSGATFGPSSPGARLEARGARKRAAAGTSMTYSRNSNNSSPWAAREARRRAGRASPPGRLKERTLM
jgi:hypothetical protein